MRHFINCLTYKKQSVNTFYFEKKTGGWMLLNDTLQYPLIEIATFANVKITDTSNYKKSLNIELNRLLNIMSKLKIKHVSAEERNNGIDMKIYFDANKALLYIADSTEVSNERWRNYIRSGKKLNKNWYFVKDY